MRLTKGIAWSQQKGITKDLDLFETKIKTTMANNFIALKRVKGLWIEAFTQQNWPEKVYCNPWDGEGVTPPIFGW